VGRVFLDANVLFSAAYRQGSGLRRLWDLEGIELVTSEYAAVEAARNLAETEQKLRLEKLMAGVELVEEAPAAAHALAAELPEKERPILTAAVHARATHLLTGDLRHFGPFLGRRLHGVLVLTPGAYLKGLDDPR